MPWRTDATFSPPLSRRLRFKAVRAPPLRGFMQHARRPPAGSTTPRSSRSPAASGCRCTRPATPTTTSASTTRSRASCSPATTCCPRSPRTSPGSVAGADPLTEFFDSLDKVAALDGVGLVLPAHGHPFADLARPGQGDPRPPRGAPRHAAHGRRRAGLGHAWRSSSQRLFKQRSWGQMAESETYAHLEHLRATGEAESPRRRTAPCATTLVELSPERPRVRRAARAR